MSDVCHDICLATAFKKKHIDTRVLLRLNYQWKHDISIIVGCLYNAVGWKLSEKCQETRLDMNKFIECTQWVGALLSFGMIW